jgi:hypothetical protein
MDVPSLFPIYLVKYFVHGQAVEIRFGSISVQLGSTRHRRLGWIAVVDKGAVGSWENPVGQNRKFFRSVADGTVKGSKGPARLSGSYGGT